MPLIVTVSVRTTYYCENTPEAIEKAIKASTFGLGGAIVKIDTEFTDE
tara:strand:- start:43 stop:186 length:144 start_codon:yes stop_codon:yes gene_type:complete